MNNGVIGYTAGTFDMFHVGHLNFLENAKKQCDYLIVGVNDDRLVKEYKHKDAIIPLIERKKIIEAIKYVDKAVVVESLDKMRYWENLHFNLLFIGSDWVGNPRWMKTQEEMSKIGVDVIFLPYTEDTSSTMLRSKLNERQG